MAKGCRGIRTIGIVRFAQVFREGGRGFDGTAACNPPTAHWHHYAILSQSRFTVNTPGSFSLVFVLTSTTISDSLYMWYRGFWMTLLLFEPFIHRKKPLYSNSELGATWNTTAMPVRQFQMTFYGIEICTHTITSLRRAKRAWLLAFSRADNGKTESE